MKLNDLPNTLVKEDLVVGEGALAEAGKEIVVHYVGWTAEGEQFDNSRARDEPLDSQLHGRDSVARRPVRPSA